MKCQRGGCESTIRSKPNLKYCEPCRLIVMALRKEGSISRQSEARKQTSATKIEAVKRKAASKIIMTDADQKAINKAVDNKHAVTLSARILRPGHPDFDSVAATVQHVTRVKAQSFERTAIYQEEPLYKAGQRHESSGEI